jgi:hypothetical protein
MGMALGPSNRRATNKQVLEARAFVQFAQSTGAVPTPEEWSEMTKGWKPADFEKVARADAKSAEATSALLDSLAQLHGQERAYHSAVGYAKIEDLKAEKFDALQKKALEEGNGSLVLMAQSGENMVSPGGTVEGKKFPPNSGLMTAFEMVNQVKLVNDGMRVQLEGALEEIDEAQKLRDAATDPDQRQRFVDELARLGDKVTDLQAQQSVSAQVTDKLGQIYAAFEQEPDPAGMEALIGQMNDLLRKAYTGQWTDNNGQLLDPATQRLVQRAVELKIGRHPFMDRGSFALLMPQVSVELTKQNAHGTVYLHQGMLKSMGAAAHGVPDRGRSRAAAPR